jgi:hypothetical protein
MNATRYVDIGMVSAKVTRTRPSPRSSRRTSAPLDRAVRSDGTTSDTAKVALAAGSSQHGNALRAKVASICVVAMVRSLPAVSVKVDR